MNRSAHWIDRRTVLETGVMGGLSLLAGCSGGSPESDPTTNEPTGTDRTESAQSDTTTASPTPDAPGFFDDFEDGDYTSDPAWQAEFEEDIGTVAVVDRETPAGGQKVLRISDATDEELNERGEPASATLTDRDEGWQGAWTLSGQFYAAAVPDGEYADDVHVALGFYETGVELLLTPRVELLFFEDRVQAESRQSVLDEGRWYDYEYTHDGSGSYTAARWPTTRDRDAGLSLTLDHEPLAASERFALVTYGGYPEFVDQTPPSPSPAPGSYRLTVDHASVRWEPDG